MDFGCPWLGVFGSDRAQYSNFGIRWFLPTEPKLICLYRPFSGGSQKKIMNPHNLHVWLAKCWFPRVAGGLGCASMGDLVGKCN